MKIVMRDGRVLKGSEVEIVEAMKALAFGVERLSLAEYVRWVAENASRFDGVELAVTGETSDELASSLVREMVRTGLAHQE